MISISFHDQVRVVPYQEEWVQRFRTTKEMIIALLLTSNIEWSGPECSPADAEGWHGR